MVKGTKKLHLTLACCCSTYYVWVEKNIVLFSGGI